MNLTTSAFDALNRVISVTDPAVGGVSGVSGYGYDLAGNRETATDQRSLTTAYVHNGFGEVIQQSSPDTGVTIFTYDAAGNRASRTDARAVVTNWSYDALNRVATMTFPASSAENVAYTYDNATAGEYGIGRLASVADDSGGTAYVYDARGNITRDTRVIQTPGQLARTYVTQYAYDIADRPVSMTYPSGRIVDYTRDSIGRVTAVDTRASELATPVALASGGTYEPFGPLNGLSRGNGVVESTTYDLDGRISALDNILDSTTTVLALDYTFDLSGDITKITDAGNGLRGRNYDYDPLHRLIDTEELLGDGLTVARGTSFGYDAVGNRTRRSVSLAGVSETEDYVNDTLSNQFQSSSITAGFLTLQSRALTHGDSGNRESDTASGIALNLNYAMAYDATDRLASVSDGATVLGAYLHNALGQRVSKTRATGAVTHYLYDLSGRLIAEADGATGITIAEYIAFEGINLAYITTAGIYWVHGDHLGTPQMLTDELGAEAWSALYAPFGMLLEETGALDFNLRFPGQYHDAETEFYYNYFRTYDPTSGRYVESDPIGLRGGWNTYGYVGGNPVGRVDAVGLIASGKWINAPYPSSPQVEFLDHGMMWPEWNWWGYINIFWADIRMSGRVRFDVECADASCGNQFTWEIHDSINVSKQFTLKLGPNVYALGVGAASGAGLPASIGVNLLLVEARALVNAGVFANEYKTEINMAISILGAYGPSYICNFGIPPMLK